MDINKFSALLFLLYFIVFLIFLAFRFLQHPERKQKVLATLYQLQGKLDAFLEKIHLSTNNKQNIEFSDSQAKEKTQIMPPLFGITIFFACIAQFLLARNFILLGVIFYVGAAIALFFYTRQSVENKIEDQVPNPIIEKIILLFIMIVAIFSRFYNLMDKPYGFEADGARVAGHTYFAYFANQPGEMSIHFDSQPTLFFMQFLAMKIGGISFLSTRVLSALMGSISVLLFFFILKRLIGSKTALLGTFFYAIGFTALYAARQTHIETAVEIWVVLTYFLLIESIYRKNLLFLFLSSVSTAAGMLCFESYYMSPIIVVLYLFLYFLKEKENISVFAKKLAIYVLPLIPLVPIVYHYLKSRMDYHFEPMAFQSAEYTIPPFIARFLFMWNSFLESLQTLFYKIRYTDSLLSFKGPMINPVLLPLFFIAFFYILFKFKKNPASFLILWFLLQYFPFGILGAPYPRVLYPGIIPVYGLAAFGFVWIINISKVYMKQFQSLLTTLAIITLIAGTWFVDNNFFWNQVFDPDDRQKRHEQSDLIIEGLNQSDVLYLPYMPNTTDDIPKEVSVNAMSAASVVGPEYVDQVLHVIPMEEMPAQVNQNTKLRSISYLIEKTQKEKFEQREAFLGMLNTCYPNQIVLNGYFFDLYKIENLQESNCYSIEPANLTSPEFANSLESGESIEFTWDFPAIMQDSAKYQLRVEQKLPTAIWIEAEVMTDKGGWYKDTIFVDDYSGDGYITDFWQADDTNTTFTINETATYNIWVKSYKRESNDQRNFIIINEEPGLELAKMSEDQYYRWVWENIGEIDLDAGEQILTLHRTYGDDAHFQVFIDEIAISSDPDFDPCVDAEWQPVFQSDTFDVKNISTFELPIELDPGHYRWNLTISDGTQLVDWQGNIGVTSPYSEFIVSCN